MRRAPGRRVLDALAPRHFRHVDQAFDARLQFDERAVVGEAHDFAGHADADRVPLDGIAPRIGNDLLVTERHALRARIVLEHDHVDFVADAHDLGRMRHAAPRHVGDVQEPVDAAQIDERAVVGEVLDRAAQHLALGERVERGLLLLRVLFLEQHLARQHDVAALLVDLDDAHAQFLPAQGIQIPHRPHVDLRSRQERAHADVHGEPALDAFDDAADDHLAFLVGLLDLVPDLHLLGLLTREDNVSLAILGPLEQHVHAVARLRGDLAGLVDELFDRNDAFGLEADVDNDFGGRHLDDGALDDLAFRDVAEAGIVKLKKVGKLLRIHVVARVVSGKGRAVELRPRSPFQDLHFLRRVVTHRVAGPPQCRQVEPADSCRISFGGL
jgi:hypothetical protein